MLTSFTRQDLGLVVVNRNGEEGRVEGIEIHFPTVVVPICYYTPDLYYYEGGDSEDPFDIMVVKLHSGIVLWERPKVIVRRFSERAALYNREDKQLPDEYKGLDGKLVSFILPAGKTEKDLHKYSLGSCGGLDVQYWDTVPVLI